MTLEEIRKKVNNFRAEFLPEIEAIVAQSLDTLFKENPTVTKVEIRIFDGYDDEGDEYVDINIDVKGINDWYVENRFAELIPQATLIDLLGSGNGLTVVNPWHNNEIAKLESKIAELQKELKKVKGE